MSFDQLASDDFAAFTAPDPAAMASQKKEAETKAKEREKKEKILKPEQLKAAKELTESMKADKEASEKSDLIQRIRDYLKLIQEYHPERLEYVRVPKTFGPKNTVDELRVWVKDLENELGKKGGLDTVKMLWVEGLKLAEKSGSMFGLNLKGCGIVAENSVANRQLPDGSVVVGPAVPTLAEFAVKYSSWFSTSVEMRLALMTMNIISAVHRMNSGADLDVPKAATTPVSAKSADLMNKI